ncbi:MAG: AHH domain-containing protein [Lachnospiraceae bacterium]|nr:AHH domain-containing protein [Lachnospiraceae bacterium]
MNHTDSGLAHGTNGSPQNTIDNSDMANKTKENEASVERIIPGKEGVITGGKSKILGKNLMDSLGVSTQNNWSGYQAQHIIPTEMRTHPVIVKIGMDFDDASNGMFLPTPNDKVKALSKHRGYHKVYSDFVRSKLDKIDINQSSIEIQKQVKELQYKLRKLQESGLPLYSGYSKNDSKSDNYPYRRGNTIDMWERRFNALR